jgi:hypothetical protein
MYCSSGNEKLLKSNKKIQLKVSLQDRISGLEKKVDKTETSGEDKEEKNEKIQME